MPAASSTAESRQVQDLLGQRVATTRREVLHATSGAELSGTVQRVSRVSDGIEVTFTTGAQITVLSLEDLYVYPGGNRGR